MTAELAPKETKVQPVIEQGIIDTFFAPRKEQEVVTPASLLKREETPTAEKTSDNRTVSRLFGEGKPHSSEALHTYEQQLTKVFKEESMASRVAEAKEEMLPKVEAVSTKNYGISSIEQVPLPPKVQAEVKPSTPSIKKEEYRIVGQVFKTYWLIQYHEKVFIIDQHAAHERVLYEKFMAEFRANEVAKQLLLMPETFTLTPTERNLLEEHAALFQNLGFEYFFTEEPFINLIK